MFLFLARYRRIARKCKHLSRWFLKFRLKISPKHSCLYNFFSCEYFPKNFWQPLNYPGKLRALTWKAPQSSFNSNHVRRNLICEDPVLGPLGGAKTPDMNQLRRFGTIHHTQKSRSFTFSLAQTHGLPYTKRRLRHYEDNTALCADCKLLRDGRLDKVCDRTHLMLRERLYGWDAAKGGVWVACQNRRFGFVKASATHTQL